MTKIIKDLAPQILEVIKESDNILLHCHPYPDPDSVGSVLAMTFALQQLGKNVCPIIGDSSYPKSLELMPDHNVIQQKNISEVSLEDFDLFIIMDSSSPTQISQLFSVEFPANLKTIVIDHHATNIGFGDVNLVDSTCCSTTHIIYLLFKEFGLDITKNMALCLFIGIFGDTGGLKYPSATPEVFEVVADLVKINPDYHKVVFEIENSKSPVSIELMGLAFTSVSKYCSDRIVISSVSYNEIRKRKLSKSDALEGLVGSYLRSVEGWDVVASLVEVEPSTVIVSLRTRDELKYDVSKVAKSIGENGGGHRGAAGTTLKMPIEEAKKRLVETIIEEFPTFEIFK